MALRDDIDRLMDRTRAVEDAAELRSLARANAEAEQLPSPAPRVSAEMVEAGKSDLAMVRRFVETMKVNRVNNTAVPLGAIERVFALIAALAVEGK